MDLSVGSRTAPAAERFILKCVGVLLFIALTQALLTKPDFRSLLSLVDRFEVNL